MQSGPATTSDSPRTIASWLRHKAGRCGDRTAVEVVDRPKSYAEVDRDSDRVAAGLAALGLRSGDHACVMMRNSLENIDVWFGLVKAGVVEVPINTANRGFLLRYLLEQSESTAVICDAEYLPRIAEAAADVPGLRHVVVNPTGADAGAPAEAVLPGHLVGHQLAELYVDAAPTADLRRDDTTVILYTSGTTGPPKGVVLSHDANLNLARHVVRLNGYTPSDRLYTAFPLFHINAKYTSVMAAMEAEATLVMDDRFSASGFWNTCREKDITAFNYQGALLMMLYKQPPRDDDADNPVRLGFGAPCPAEIWQAFERRFGLRLVEVYGMTEIAIATENRLDDFRVGSAGRTTADYQVRVVDEHDWPVPTGAAGEIVVQPRKPGIMVKEYYKMPEATVDAFRNLWFHTGDRGRMDEDGYLYFLDRIKDTIRRRGENISTWEVENVVAAHPQVIEAAAYGVTSELAEEEVMVAVVAQSEQPPGPDELVAYCHDNMSAYAVPRFVRFVEELPKTPSQRMQKYKLRDEGTTPDTWDREAADHG